MGPETRYALSGDVHIACQVIGDGPFDLVFVPGFVTHMELQWRLPGFEAFLRTLGSFSRLIGPSAALAQSPRACTISACRSALGSTPENAR